MERAEKIGKTLIADAASSALELLGDFLRSTSRSLCMFIKNLVSSHAKAAVPNGVLDGYDAWRTRMKDQMPLAADKRRILMSEFMAPTSPFDEKGIRKAISDIERIVDQWERVAGKAFDVEGKVWKLQELTPSQKLNFIAQQARGTK